MNNPIKTKFLKTSTLNINLFLISLLIAGFIIAFFPVLKKLVLNWSTSDDYSHGFLIIPLSLYIIWSKKEILKKVTINPSIPGLFLILFSLVAYIAAYYAEISTIASFSLVSLIIGMVIYFFGFPMLKELVFPIAFLLFMIPVPAQIYASLTLPLQLFVSTISSFVSNTIGVPVFRDGNIIQIPDHTLQVVSACSGLRSIVSLLALSAVFGFFTLKSNLLRTILLLSGIPISIFVNIIRILLMIMAFHYFNFDLAKESMHTLFGITIYLLALFAVFVVQKGISIWDQPR